MVLAVAGGLFCPGREIASPSIGQTCEISSSLTGPGIGIAARDNTCSFIGHDGCNAGLLALASQRHSFPTGAHPFALELEKRRLSLSAVAALEIKPENHWPKTATGAWRLPLLYFFLSAADLIRLPA
jgi:hypothetical protein